VTAIGGSGREPVWRHHLMREGERPDLALAAYDGDAAKAVLVADAEPRFHRFAGADVLVLRGINFNTGDRPEDMVSLRILIADGRVETLARRPVRAVEATQSHVAAHPEARAGEIVLHLIESLVARLNDAVDELSDKLDDLEDRIESPGANPEPQHLARLRRRAIWLHRFCHPQARALDDAGAAHPEWLDRAGRVRLNEQRHAMARIVADLAVLRDHSRILQERSDQELRERARRTSFALTLIAGVFLPLNLVGALFGANVGGIPFAHDPLGFWYLLGSLLALVAVELALLRWLRWI
jgi:zinc transporter